MSRTLDVLLHFALLFAAIMCWVFSTYRKRSDQIHYVGLFLFVTALFDGIAATIMMNKYYAQKLISNLFLYHILTPIQYLIIIKIYADVIMNTRIKKIALWSIPIFFILSICLSLTIQPFTTYNAYSVLIKHLLIITFVLIYFIEVISSTPYTKVYTQPVFWISVGFLFHSTLNVLLEGVSNYLRTYGSSTYETIYLLYSISNYFLFFLLGVALLISNLKREVNGSESSTQW